MGLNLSFIFVVHTTALAAHELPCRQPVAWVASIYEYSYAILYYYTTILTSHLLRCCLSGAALASYMSQVFLQNMYNFRLPVTHAHTGISLTLVPPQATRSEGGMRTPSCSCLPVPVRNTFQPAIPSQRSSSHAAYSECKCSPILYVIF